MTNYRARLSVQRDEVYEKLLIDQSTKVGSVTLDDLKDFDEMVTGDAHRQALIMLDRPNPARGYALAYQLESGGEVNVRLHVLQGTDEAATRALLERTEEVSRAMRSGGLVLDTSTAAPHVLDVVRKLGGAYNLFITPADAAGAPQAAEQPAAGTNTQEQDESAADEPLAPAGMYVVSVDYGNGEAEKISVDAGTRLSQFLDNPIHPEGLALQGWAWRPFGAFDAELMSTNATKTVKEDMYLEAVWESEQE